LPSPEIDGWLIRKGINELQGYDNFPEPKIVSAALEACKRVNDHSLAVRFLEALKVMQSIATRTDGEF
jgi:cytochrome c oxidase subunit 5a